MVTTTREQPRAGAGDAAAGRWIGAGGVQLEFASSQASGAEEDERFLFTHAPGGSRWALFMVVEGAAPEAAALLHAGIRRALERDRGTATTRLLRAVRDGCRRLESQALHRFELAGLGLTALLVEDGYAYLTQLLPSQAYVVEDGGTRAMPETPMRGADRVGSAAGRRWEVEIDHSRVAIRQGMTFVLCSSGLAEDLSPSRVEATVRQPVVDAAASLSPRRLREARGRQHGAIVIRSILPSGRPVRTRLLSVESQRRPRAVPGLADPAGAPRARIEAWGLRAHERRALPGLGVMLGGGRPSVSRARRGGRLPWIALAVVPALIAGAVVFRDRLSVPEPALPEATGSPPQIAAPALAGRTALTAREPFRSLAVGGGVARVLDSANQITAAVSSGPAPVSAGSGTGQLLALAARDAEIIALDGGRTVWRLPEAAGEAARPLPLRAASLWLRPQAIAAYGGSLYVLDGGAPGSGGQIWRHSAGPTGGFDGDAQAWLQPNSGANVESATGMAIDGSIWISRADGSVLKLTNGRPEPFTIKGLEGGLQTAGAIYTERAFTSVYVVDSAARRLLKLSKDGQVEGQVADAVPFGELVRGLWVDEPGRRALLLTDRRLQELSF